ncbi:MAG: MBL fold metallo-hydrolase [Candidatus Diapherotrites archaeon]|nr:MBL fold metallo-hydrolase [Candidatus Diapherotrites archaeon]
MDILWKKGLLLSDGISLAIDCSYAEHSIVTHAHTDHVFSSKGAVIGSEETLRLIEKEKSRFARKKPLKIGERTELGSFEISLKNSGHILGSAQVYIDASERIAITSDFKLQDSLITEGAEILQCDALVIETTFGLPEYVFPEREKVYQEFASWANKQLASGHYLILSGYALGKAQELTAFANEYLGASPVVHEEVYKNNQIYEEFGVKLGTYFKLDHNLRESNVLILPPSLCSTHLFQAVEYSIGKKVASAKASGWPYKGCFDKIFPLSDHADFDQLITYVKESGAKQVYTMHGFSREFAQHIRHRFGINTKQLDINSQQKALWESEK